VTTSKDGLTALEGPRLEEDQRAKPIFIPSSTGRKAFPELRVKGEGKFNDLPVYVLEASSKMAANKNATLPNKPGSKPGTRRSQRLTPTQNVFTTTITREIAGVT